jgi:hypothetical protein
MWLVRRPALIVFLCGLLLHAGLLAVAKNRTGRVDGYAFRSLDCGEFYSIARNVAEYGTFSQSEGPPLVADTWRTPGYPLFLAALILVVGDSPSTLVVLQQLLGVVNGLLLFILASQYMNERRSLMVSLLFLLEPYHLWYSLWLMSTSLFVTTLLLAWLAWQRLVQNGGWLPAMALGATCGYAVLIRPVASLVPFALLAALAIRAFRAVHASPSESSKKSRTGWQVLLLFALSCAVVAGSWMYRTYRTAGHFALSEQSGIVLAYFKATEVELWNQGRTQDRYVETTLDPTRRDERHGVWEEIDEQLRARFPLLPETQRQRLGWQTLAQGNKTSVDSFAISRALSKIGWSYLLEHPLNTAACLIARCGSLLTFPLNLVLKPPTGVVVSRFRSLAFGGAYLALLLAVAWRLLRRRIELDAVLFPLACSVALLIATSPQLDPRFRVPLIPLLIFLALLPREAHPAPPTGIGAAPEPCDELDSSHGALPSSIFHD